MMDNVALFHNKFLKILYFSFLGIGILSISHNCLGVNVAKVNFDTLMDMSIEDLMDVVVVKTASGVDETLADAPATMVVITAKDIRKRGYTDLTEVVTDLPGFDVMLHNGAYYISAQQRGYRTLGTTRTLFMIDGVIENGMGSSEAMISRQYPLSNIERIEVLYGPASAIYGPNAFLGIINIITQNAAKLNKGEYHAEANGSLGSYSSKGLDILLQGRPTKDLSFSITYKKFKSDEPDFTGKFGFLDQHWFEDEKIWGPLLQLGNAGRKFGEYYDPSDEYSIFADVKYKDWKLGIIHWRLSEGFGPFYAADHSQNNSSYKRLSDQAYIEYTPQLTNKLKSHTQLLYREFERHGQIADAEPDKNPGMEDYSFVSFVNWNRENSSWLFKQDFDYQASDNLLLSFGIKYERREVSKAYDIPGYWEGSAISSSAEPGTAIIHSSESEYPVPPPPADMPAYNLANIEDKGVYIQSIYDWEKYRFSLGIRYDNNSMYGSVINPRTSLIFRYNKQFTFKLLYGEAFQEPPPMMLWGGWNGREARTDLKPEKARTLETVVMYQNKGFTQEASFYSSHYSDVIKEEAENAGTRDIYGFEYRAKAKLPSFLENVEKPDIYFNYTHTHVESSIYYNHDVGEWQEGDAILGDIAPHKFNLGLNLPLNYGWNFNLRGNFVGKRELYLRNALRAQGEKTGAYFVLNSALSYNYKPFEITFKIKNLLDKNYLHPGPASADSGNDFSQRALGYHNSLIPQPGRSWWLNVKWTFGKKPRAR